MSERPKIKYRIDPRIDQRTRDRRNQRIVERYKSGVTISDLARNFRLDRSTVRWIIRTHSPA